MPSKVPLRLELILKLWATAKGLEFYTWLALIPMSFAIALARPLDSDPQAAQHITYLALFFFAFASRCLSFLSIAALDIALLVAEVVGVIVFTVASETIWRIRVQERQSLLIASLVGRSFFATVRFSSLLLSANHTFSRRSYSKSSLDLRTFLLPLSNRWNQMRISYHSERVVSGYSTELATGMLNHDQSCPEVPGETDCLAMQTRQARKTGLSLFERCTYYHDHATSVKSAQINDPETGRRRTCKKYQKWIEYRNQWMEDFRATFTQDPSEALNLEPSEKPQRLCDVCEYFCYICCTSIWGFGEIIIYNHLSSPNELRKSSRRGCHLCTMLWSLLNDAEQKELLAGDLSPETDYPAQILIANSTQPQTEFTNARDAQSYIQLAICGTNLSVGSILPFYGNQRLPGRWPYDTPKRPRFGSPKRFVFAALEIHHEYQHRNNEESGKAMLRAPPSNTGNDSTKDRILKTFTLDPLLANSPWLPARLLEVSDLVTTGRVRVRRREELEDKIPRAYVALSHCWGTNPFLTYNRKTQAEFETGISVSLLTKTFQEAIEMTHRLGFHFIWIDSLCILQGAIDEWHNEASAMGQVYRFAALTLVAAASKDGSEGLLRDIDTLATTKCILHWNKSRPKRSYLINPQSSWRQGEDEANDILRSKWIHRGWTLQEQLLSRRLVYFGQRGVYLRENDTDSKVPTGSTAYRLEEAQSARLRKSNMSWHQQWWLWVLDFTNRQLSNPDDRGMAILGLADHVAASSGFTYIDGLWKEHILGGLLWYVQMGHVDHRTASCRGPSWSWISAEGSIYNDSSSMLDSKAGIALTGISTAEQDRSHNQPSAEGRYLELHGKVRTCVWAAETAGDARFYLARGQLDEFQLDLKNKLRLANVASAATYEVGPRCYPMFLNECDSKPIGWFLPDTTDLSSIPRELHCLCINVEPIGNWWTEGFTSAFATRGLVLEQFHIRHDIQQSSEKSCSNVIPAFKRIGYFELESEGKAVAVTRYSRNFEPLKLRKAPAQMRQRILEKWREPLKVERVPPITDPGGFFADCKPQTLRLY